MLRKTQKATKGDKDLYPNVFVVCVPKLAIKRKNYLLSFCTAQLVRIEYLSVSKRVGRNTIELKK